MTLLEAIAFITGAPVSDYTEPHAELGEALFDNDPAEGVILVVTPHQENIDLLDEQLALLTELTALETILEGMDK